MRITIATYRLMDEKKTEEFIQLIKDNYKSYRNAGWSIGKSRKMVSDNFKITKDLVTVFTPKEKSNAKNAHRRTKRKKIS